MEGSGDKLMVKTQKHRLYFNSIYLEDIIEKRKNEIAEEELKAYLERISKCPYCPMRFVGTPANREKVRKEHIEREHSGKKPFISM